MPAEFYLTTAGEYGPLTAPRVCWSRGRLNNGYGDQHMLAQIQHVLSGQHFGLNHADIGTLIFSPKWKDRPLFPMSVWPIPIYVSRILDEAIVASGTFTREQIEIIAWGFLFHTLDEAASMTASFES